jgi:hypothetical protein
VVWNVSFLAGLVIVVGACGFGSGASQVASPTGDARLGDGAQAPAESLAGVWRQDYSCEQSVATFRRLTYEHGAAGRATFRRYVVRDGFAWGRKGATGLTPKALCKGAADQYRIMKIGGGRLTFFDGPSHQADLTAVIKFLDDSTFTLFDGGQNLTGTERFTFRIVGGRLFVRIHGRDEWSGTSFEEAPFVRVS